MYRLGTLLIIVYAMFIVYVMCGCSGDMKGRDDSKAISTDVTLTEQQKAAMAEPLEPLTVEYGDMEVVIDAPKGCIVEPGFRTMLRKGPYQLEVLRDHADLEHVKQTAQSNDLHAFWGTVIDEADLYAYRQKGYGGEPEYIFVYNTTVDGDKVHVSNEIIAPRPNSEEHLRWLIKAGKTVRAPE